MRHAPGLVVITTYSLAGVTHAMNAPAPACRHLAAAEGQFDAVEWLVTRRLCNPSPVDRFGRTPLEVEHQNATVISQLGLQILPGDET